MLAALLWPATKVSAQGHTLVLHHADGLARTVGVLVALYHVANLVGTLLPYGGFSFMAVEVIFSLRLRFPPAGSAGRRP